MTDIQRYAHNNGKMFCFKTGRWIKHQDHIKAMEAMQKRIDYVEMAAETEANKKLASGFSLADALAGDELKDTEKSQLIDDFVAAHLDDFEELMK